VIKLKNTLKATAFALSFLFGAGILVQNNVYAKERPSKEQGRVRAEAVQASDKGKDSVEKTIPFGLSKSTLPPVIKQGGILIPVKVITKSFAANLVWDDVNQVLTITKGDVTIVINLDTKIATVNGTQVPLQDNSVSNNGTFVPLKFIAENLGITLDETEAGQTSDETQVTDGTQTSDSETVTQENTSTTNTDVQTSTDNTTTTNNTTTTAIQN
jgi:hypothetical protein